MTYVDKYKDNYGLWLNDMFDIQLRPEQVAFEDAWANILISSSEPRNSGKTTYMVTKALHFLTTNIDSHVIYITPTGRQASYASELATTLLRRAPTIVQGAFNYTRNKIHVRDGWYLHFKSMPSIGLSDLMGHCCPSLFIIGDEIFVEPEIYDSIAQARGGAPTYGLFLGTK